MTNNFIDRLFTGLFLMALFFHLQGGRNYVSIYVVFLPIGIWLLLWCLGLLIASFGWDKQLKIWVIEQAANNAKNRMINKSIRDAKKGKF